MNNTIIESHFKDVNLDIRKKGNNPRFLDQKCTPDVLSFIADCILQIDQKEFTAKNILTSSHFQKELITIFGKPNPNEKSQNEYDKFISQPLDLLSYANVIEKYKVKTRSKYKIIDYQLLEYLGLRDINAAYFLKEYLKKFSIDSAFYEYFSLFKKKQDQESFTILKNKFQNLVVVNSNIGNKGAATNNNTEIRRIFAKYINILSWNECKGSKKGRLSKHKINYTDLVYNRENFRDLDKPKDKSRKDFRSDSTERYNNHLIEKAKKSIKKYHPYSEIDDDLYGETSHVHHIFPQSEFSKISSYLENLIALTAGQHLDKAHPKGNTKIIDRTYQLLCLLYKNETIKKFESQGLIIYSKLRFVEVLHIGLNIDDTVIQDNYTFQDIEDKIKLFYKENF